MKKNGLKKLIIESVDDFFMEVEDVPEFYQSFDPEEFDDEAKKAFQRDIEKEGGKFEEPGKSEFEKGMSAEDLIRALIRAEMGLPDDEEELEKLKPDIETRKKGFSLNEAKKDVILKYIFKNLKGGELKQRNIIKEWTRDYDVINEDTATIQVFFEHNDDDGDDYIIVEKNYDDKDLHDDLSQKSFVQINYDNLHSTINEINNNIKILLK